MRIIFLGTSLFALPCLQTLIKSDHEILSVISRPPRPAGRGKILRQPPVAAFCMENQLTLLQPPKLTGDFIEEIRSTEPDIMISAAYGAWLPQELLDSSPRGVVNIHPSELPQYRGAAPVARAILDGRDETGISFMLTDSGWDTGPVIAVYPEKILPDDTTGSLEGRLARKAAEKLISVIQDYAGGKLRPVEQIGEEHYAKKITTDETWIEWGRPAKILERKVRAFQPSPGARTLYSGKLLKIIEVRLSTRTAHPGEIVIDGNSLTVGCSGDESLEILRLQPASKKSLSAIEFLRGARMETGDRFGKT